jgi:hypothetical protein
VNLPEPKIHTFRSSLAASHSASDMPFWEECYKKAFPTMIGMHDHRQDGPHQRQGIDRSVVLGNGKTLWIDEKVRFTTYEDIVLEEWSSWERKVPGWVAKPLFADYIAYAIAPLGKCFVLPVLQLQQAWRVRGELWRSLYRRIPVPNAGYTTVCWAIPVPVLFQAIGDCLRVRFTPVTSVPVATRCQQQSGDGD